MTIVFRFEKSTESPTNNGGGFRRCKTHPNLFQVRQMSFNFGAGLYKRVYRSRSQILFEDQQDFLSQKGINFLT